MNAGSSSSCPESDSAASRVARAGALACLSLVLAGCAASYAPQRLAPPAELTDPRSRTIGDVTVTVAMLTDEQARRHFGVDLGRHELHALWISVRNASPHRLWFIRTILDPDYYSADEVALLVEDDVPRADREQLRQSLRDEELRALLAPRTVTEGFVYLPRVEGGRYVDLRLQGDAHEIQREILLREEGTSGPHGRPPRELRFEFALRLPDGDFDYERLDAELTYAGRDLADLTLEELRAALEELPCCTTDSDGEGQGDPLNVVLVGTAAQVLNSLSRSGWSFTHRIDLRSIRREIGAAISGDAYPVAPVSSLYVFGRRQELALQRARRSIAQRNHMRLWLAPFTFEKRSVWVGQVSRDIGIKLTPKSPTLTTHVIDPQVDTTREYLFHSLIGQGFVDRFGFVVGASVGTPEDPQFNLTGDPYFTDGMRLVVILPPDPVPPDRIRSLLWEQSAAPIAEGQSEEAARRNVRPIEDAAPGGP